MKANQKLTILLVCICVVIFFTHQLGLTSIITSEKLILLLQGNLLFSAFLFIAIFCLANLLYIPGWIVISAPIIVFPPTTAYLLILTGAISACCTSFFLISYFGKGLLNELKNKYANKALSQLESNPIRTIFILRVFLQTNPALNYTLSMSKVSFKNYFLGTVLGLPIPVAIFCIFYDFISGYLGYS